LAIPNFLTVSLGGVGVSLFLVLSGLVLELRYGGKKYDYGNFLVKRLARIYPVYCGCLAIGVILYLYREWFLGAKATYFGELTIREWVCSLSGTCAYLGWWGGPFVVTGWFIGVIVGLYLLFPLMSRLMAKSVALGLTTAFVVSLMTLGAIHKGWLGWGWRPEEWMPLARLFEFTLGMWLATVIPKDWWRRLDARVPAKKIWPYLGALSFPYFLVHFELRLVITVLRELIPTWLAVAVFVLLSGIVSQGVLSGVATLSKKKLFSTK